MTDKTEPEETLAKIELAMDELLRLLKPGEHIRMSIPAEPKRDTDFIIMDALQSAKDLLVAGVATHNTVSREQIMLSLHAEGAYCGLCDFENAIYEDRSDGIEWRCRDCEKCLARYTDAVLALLNKDTTA